MSFSLETQYCEIVVITGAGVSQESGIETFRDPDGIWIKYNIEDVATPQAFKKKPQLVHEFYNQRRRKLLDPIIQPNAAHYAIAKLEKNWPGGIFLITQNVDNLHERAGSKNLIHMHGELLKSRCNLCDNINECLSDLSIDTMCKACKTKGSIRPHIVWFNENPLFTCDIESAVDHCKLFISIGTSGTVYPAASYVRRASEVAKAYTISLNLEEPTIPSIFNESREGPATRIVTDFVDELLSTKTLPNAN